MDNKTVSFVLVDFISLEDRFSFSVPLGLIVALSFSNYSALLFRFNSITSTVTLKDTYPLRLTVAVGHHSLKLSIRYLGEHRAIKNSVNFMCVCFQSNF